MVLARPESRALSFPSVTTAAETLAAQVRVLRQARGFTRKTLAEAAALSLRFVAEIEAGRANPSLSSLESLARALGEHPFTLLTPNGTSAHTTVYALLTTLSADGARELQARLAEGLSNSARPIVLLGIRGAGKSTIGRALASALGRPFVELDARVEREAGMDLRAIFELHGERHYRALERACLDGALGEPGAAIIAASGGVVDDDDTWRALTDRARTVWLRASAEAHWERVIAQGDRRPMEGRARAFAELEDLLKRRAPLYARADIVVDTTGRTPSDIVAHLVDLATRA